MKEQLEDLAIIKVMSGFTSLVAILASKPLLLDIFPNEYFAFAAAVYGFMGNFAYGMIIIFRRYSDFVNGIGGVQPYSLPQLLLIAIRPIVSSFLTFLLYAITSAGVHIYDADFFVIFRSTQGVFLFSIIAGIGFEFISSRWMGGFLTTGIKKLMTTGLESLLNWLKK